MGRRIQVLVLRIRQLCSNIERQRKNCTLHLRNALNHPLTFEFSLMRLTNSIAAVLWSILEAMIDRRSSINNLGYFRGSISVTGRQKMTSLKSLKRPHSPIQRILHSNKYILIDISIQELHCPPLHRHTKFAS
jgi:hypothetical protein